MDLRPLLQSLQTVQPLAEVYARLDAGAPLTLGVSDASKPATAALLWRRARAPLLLVAARESDAESYVDQLRAWVGDAVTPFPARAGLPYERQIASDEVTWQRIAALAQLDIIRWAEVVHFLGPPGTGKSHLATALGVAL